MSKHSTIKKPPETDEDLVKKVSPRHTKVSKTSTVKKPKKCTCVSGTGSKTSTIKKPKKCEESSVLSMADGDITRSDEAESDASFTGTNTGGQLHQMKERWSG